jgi:cyclopropane fatty-acyl-phospholipid synthase-like methyltransferase
MTDDLVKFLRRSMFDDGGLSDDAADRIEELEAALREIETLELDPRNSGQMWVEALRQIARAALEKKDERTQR